MSNAVDIIHLSVIIALLSTRSNSYDKEHDHLATQLLVNQYYHIILQ